MLKFVLFVLTFLIAYRVLQILYRIYLLQSEKEKGRITIKQDTQQSSPPSKNDGEYIEYEEVK